MYFSKLVKKKRIPKNSEHSNARYFMPLSTEFFKPSSLIWRSLILYVMQMDIFVGLYIVWVLILLIILSKYYWLALFRTGVHGKLFVLFLFKVLIFLDATLLGIILMWEVGNGHMNSPKLSLKLWG